MRCHSLTIRSTKEPSTKVLGQRLANLGSDAVVEIFPGTDGLLHISQISDRRVNKVTDELQEGDQVLVKVLDVDQNGRIKLSHKEAVRERDLGTYDWTADRPINTAG